MSTVREDIEARLQRPRLADFWKPETDGETLIGQVTGIKPNNFKKPEERDPGDLFYVVNDGSEELSTSAHVALQQLLGELKIDQGDFVYLRFEGKTRSKSTGRSVFTYSGTKLTEEEAKELGVKTGEIVVPPPETKEEEPTHPPERSPDELTEPELEEIQEFMDKLFSFYPEMTVSELDNHLNNVRGFGVDTVLITEHFKLKVDEGKVTKE